MFLDRSTNAALRTGCNSEILFLCCPNPEKILEVIAQDAQSAYSLNTANIVRGPGFDSWAGQIGRVLPTARHR